MTIRYAALWAAAVALPLTGCGHDDVVEPAGPAPGATVTVQARIAPGPHGEMFTEGAVPEIRLVGPDGTLSPVEDHRDVSVFRDVAPGRYRLEAALRTCEGNCGSLDGPTSPCSHQVKVSADGTFVVRWRVGSACRVARA